MAKLPATEKIISARHVQRCWSRLLHNVAAKGTTYIVTKKGEPVAAVVPMTDYKQWKENRPTLFDSMHMAQQRSSLTSQQGEALAQEAVEVVRAEDTNGSSRQHK